MFLECAIEAEANYLISGDRHLRRLKNFQGIEIIAPREYLSRLRTKQEDSPSHSSVKLQGIAFLPHLRGYPAMWVPWSWLSVLLRNLWCRLVNLTPTGDCVRRDRPWAKAKVGTLAVRQ